MAPEGPTSGCRAPWVHGPRDSLDYDDQPAIHLWLTEDDNIVALCRVCPAGTHMEEVSIGRVITTVRGKGYEVVF